jgi:hypothetical protein
MAHSNNPIKRAKGPNEKYGRWDKEFTQGKNITFDRRKAANSKDVKKFVQSYDFALQKMMYARDFLEFLPAEPHFNELAKIVGTKRHRNFEPMEYGKIRLFLLNQRLVNYTWFEFIKYEGKTLNGTVYYLNPLGKFYYQKTFQKSPDTMAKGFYRDKVISNRDCSVRHIDHLEAYYRSLGYNIVCGCYPFDLIVNGKHCFILTEMHENSIGIEMRLSKAIFQSMRDGFNLYLPAMTPEHRRRICSIVGGLLYDIGVPAFSFVSYLESEICCDRNVNNWSYFVTRQKEGPSGRIFSDPLPFPKIDVDSSEIVATQLTGLSESEKESIAKRVVYKHPMQFVNGLDGKELIPGVRVIAGFGQIRKIWQGIANGADILLTAKIRSTILDNLPDLPKTMIINKFDLEEHDWDNTSYIAPSAENVKTTDEQVYRTLKRRNVEIIMLPRNHAKAVLKGYKILIHSMPTTNFMGNNIESFALIDFSQHPQKDTIHRTLYNMLIAFGHEDEGKFIQNKRLLKEMFQDRISFFGHFSEEKTVDWVYYKQLINYSYKKDAQILTSHIDFIHLARRAKTIFIQGVSRYANHVSLMEAKCPVIKKRMWHPRMMYNDDFVSLGSWDFAQITNQKELQVIFDFTPLI